MRISDWIADVCSSDIDANLLALPRELANTLFTSLGLTPPVILGATRLIHERVDQKAPEAAAFIDTTFNLTSKLKLAAGGRFYRNTVDADIFGEGLLLAPSGSLDRKSPRLNSSH